MKKLTSILSVFAIAVFASTAQAAVIGNITINGDTSPNVGSSVNFSGSCGATASGTVTYTLSAGGTTTSVGSATLDSSGNFNSSVTVPSSFNSGSTNLVATCPNGDTVTGTLDVMVPAGSSVNIGGNAGLGGNISVSGVCGTSSAGSTVSFALTNGSTTFNLGSTTTTNVNGNFSGNVTIPSNFVAGPATLTVTCPGTGNTIQAALNVSDPEAALSIDNNQPVVGGVVRLNGDCNTTAGQGVQIAYVSGSTRIVLGNVVTDANGVFNASLTLPNVVVAGSGQIQATCPSGNVVTTAVTVVDPAANNDNGSTDDDDNGDVGGVTDDDSTPTGGVAAGLGGTDSSSASAWLMLAALVGVAGAAYYGLRSKLMFNR